MVRFALPLFAAFALLISLPASAREKSDVITLVNGDRITGEIVELEYGKLSLKTDSLGTVSIDWLDIVSINSPHNFFVESNAGDRYSGRITTAPEPGHILIAGKSAPLNLSVKDVAIVSQLEAGFIERIDGSVSFGFDQTKSTGVSSLSFAFDTEYRSEKNIAGLDGTYNSTNTDEQGTQNQYTLTFANQFLRPGDHYWLGLASYESNEQQGIDGRLLAGAARGRYWVRTSITEFSTFVGAVGVQEWATGASDNVQSAEGILGVEWKVFRFYDPKTSLTSRLLILPGLTETGRYRGNTSISLDHEIVNDLYIDLSFNGSYDSDPPATAADNMDYSVTTSLSYKF